MSKQIEVDRVTTENGKKFTLYLRLNQYGQARTVPEIGDTVSRGIMFGQTFDAATGSYIGGELRYVVLTITKRAEKLRRYRNDYVNNLMVDVWATVANQD